MNTLQWVCLGVTTVIAAAGIVLVATEQRTWRKLQHETARIRLRSKAHCLVLDDRLALDDVRRQA